MKKVVFVLLIASNACASSTVDEDFFQKFCRSCEIVTEDKQKSEEKCEEKCE